MKINSNMKKLKNCLVQYDKQGNMIHCWDSIKEAAEFYDLNRRSLDSCLRGENKTCRGFVWEYNDPDLPDEEWKSYGGYKVSNMGRIRGNKNGRIMRPHLCRKGYPYLNFNSKSIKVHRVVAKLWIPNPDRKPQVNHINMNKTDNRIVNLEWVTNQENQVHAIQTRKKLT